MIDWLDQWLYPIWYLRYCHCTTRIMHDHNINCVSLFSIWFWVLWQLCKRYWTAHRTLCKLIWWVWLIRVTALKIRSDHPVSFVNKVYIIQSNFKWRPTLGTRHLSRTYFAHTPQLWFKRFSEKLSKVPLLNVLWVHVIVLLVDLLHVFIGQSVSSKPSHELLKGCTACEKLQFCLTFLNSTEHSQQPKYILIQ